MLHFLQKACEPIEPHGERSVCVVAEQLPGFWRHHHVIVERAKDMERDWLPAPDPVSLIW